MLAGDIQYAKDKLPLSKAIDIDREMLCFFYCYAAICSKSDDVLEKDGLRYAFQIITLSRARLKPFIALIPQDGLGGQRPPVRLGWTWRRGVPMFGLPLFPPHQSLNRWAACHRKDDTLAIRTN